MTDTQLTTQHGRPPIFELREKLEKRKGELRLSLPSDISPDMFIRAVVTAAQINPEIIACTFQSIWDACLRACRDGLLPDGQEGAIVTYKGKAGWIPMTQGLLRRARRSGQLKWITAGVVKRGEHFSHYIDETGEHIKHVPGDNFAAEIESCYAMATTLDGGLFITVLPKAEADKMKAMSRATRDDAPWKTWPEEMYKKTALRRLSKFLPSVRDLFSDEDEDEHEYMSREPALQTSVTNIKAPQADRTMPLTQAGLDEGSGAQGTPATDTSPARDVAGETPAATASDDVSLAFERGVQARALGHKRSALPGEYRPAEHTREAEAWFRGFDGKPL
jgi:recombination protein RecT